MKRSCARFISRGCAARNSSTRFIKEVGSLSALMQLTRTPGIYSNNMLPAITDSEKKQQSREELAPLFLAWLAGAAVQYYSHMRGTWITLEIADYTKAYQPPTLDGTFCTWVKEGYPIRLKPFNE